MATKRKRSPRRKGAGGVAAPIGLNQWEHGAFTFEGEIERLGAISRNMSTAPRWTRLVARGVAVMILLSLAVGLVTFVVGLLTH